MRPCDGAVAPFMRIAEIFTVAVSGGIYRASVACACV
jgi:hypothetical protein